MLKTTGFNFVSTDKKFHCAPVVKEVLPDELRVHYKEITHDEHIQPRQSLTFSVKDI